MNVTSISIDADFIDHTGKMICSLIPEVSPRPSSFVAYFRPTEPSRATQLRLLRNSYMLRAGDRSVSSLSLKLETDSFAIVGYRPAIKDIFFNFLSVAANSLVKVDLQDEESL